jgi:ribosomal protein S18 acetylase RimI-like enzyme
MKLFPMTEQEYAFWKQRSITNYAANKMKANLLTQSEADRVAASDFEKFLPKGLQTETQFLYTAKDEAKNVLGYLWFGVSGEKEKSHAYIFDVVIESEYRGKGMGKQIMLLAEHEIKKLGAKRVGLHVFAFNEVAINLYKSLNYEISDLVMQKNL